MHTTLTKLVALALVLFAAGCGGEALETDAVESQSAALKMDQNGYACGWIYSTTAPWNTVNMQYRTRIRREGSSSSHYVPNVVIDRDGTHVRLCLDVRGEASGHYSVRILEGHWGQAPAPAGFVTTWHWLKSFYKKAG